MGSAGRRPGAPWRRRARTTPVVILRCPTRRTDKELPSSPTVPVGRHRRRQPSPSNPCPRSCPHTRPDRDTSTTPRSTRREVNRNSSRRRRCDHQPSPGGPGRSETPTQAATGGLLHRRRCRTGAVYTARGPHRPGPAAVTQPSSECLACPPGPQRPPASRSTVASHRTLPPRVTRRPEVDGPPPGTAIPG